MNHLTKPFRWLWAHPVALINVIGLAIALGIFIYLLTKPIDVLEDWGIATTKQAVSGVLPVYYPGGTLEFKSHANKLISADGNSTRIFDCDATATQPARIIYLDPVPATRAPGYNPDKETSILVPAVSQFNGLPRTCRLVINVCYDNVVLWRDHCESARTNDFLVQEATVDPTSIQNQIEELREKIKELEDQALSALSNQKVTTTQSNTTTTTTTNSNQKTSPSPSPVASVAPEKTVTTTCDVKLLGFINLFCHTV